MIETVPYQPKQQTRSTTSSNNNIIRVNPSTSSTRNYVDNNKKSTSNKRTIQKEIHSDDDNTILWVYDVTDHTKYHQQTTYTALAVKGHG